MSLLDEIAEQVRACEGCPLSEGRTNAVPGEGAADAQIMFVGEAPGREEDRQGRPFVGPAGKVLDRLLGRIGLSREQVYITNIVKCRPPENRDPKPDEIEACREYLDGQIAFIKPRLVCTLGRPALQTLLDPKAAISKVHAQVIEREGLTYVPLYHPAAGLHNKAMQPQIIEGFDRLRELLERYTQTTPGEP